MNPTSYYVCSKCGCRVEVGNETGWLVAQRKGKAAGHLIIRCPQHITDYAIRQIGEARSAA